MKNDLDMGLIIFSTESNLRHLCEKDTVLMDGTFEYAPKFFRQLLQLMGIAMECISH